MHGFQTSRPHFHVLLPMIDVPSQPRSGMRKWGALAVVLGIQGHLLEVTSKPSPVAASDMDGRVSWILLFFDVLWP